MKLSPYIALAIDYDGTLALNGKVARETVVELEKFLATGRLLVLVSGRELGELGKLFPQLNLFSWVVAENGAVAYEPATRREVLLTGAVKEELYQSLLQAKVEPLFRGKVILATQEPNESVVLDHIRNLGLELQLIFNKGAVMVLPPGINKATGLDFALRELKLSSKNILGIGDAENDHSFMSVCGCSFAVANALDSIKQIATARTTRPNGAGVREVITHVLENMVPPPKIEVPLLIDLQGEMYSLSPFRDNILIAGKPGKGKSTVAVGLLERLNERGYQYCVIDPESDYEEMPNAVVLGSPSRPPELKSIFELLENSFDNLIVNISGIALADRVSFFVAFAKKFQAMKSHLGRPHFLLIDEAHHVLPREILHELPFRAEDLSGWCFVTVFPRELHHELILATNLLLAFDGEDRMISAQFAAARGIDRPASSAQSAEDALSLWDIGRSPSLISVEIIPPAQKPPRHRGKYAEGELPDDRSFYFRGPEGKLNLKAHNLSLFVQIGEGVDDTTWSYHLHNGDYSDWFRTGVKDKGLAQAVERIASLSSVSVQEARQMLKREIEQRYLPPVES